MHASPTFALLAVVSFPIALVAACGGSAFNSASGAGGADGVTSATNGPTTVGNGTGNGTTSGTGGSATGTGGMDAVAVGAGGQMSAVASTGSGGGDACPKSQPSPGGACSSNGQMCSYEDFTTCCSADFTCVNDAWSAGSASCSPPPQCPAGTPNQGAACTCNQKCSFGACGSLNLPFTATCNNQQWNVKPVACPNTTPCPSVPCDAGKICLTKIGGAVMEPSCVDDPCSGQALSCACAKAALCPNNANETCTTNGSDTITCTCPVCP